MYYEEVEKYFIRKRERAASLAPIDWPIVKSWEERGIPLEVVFKGIDNAFARFREKSSSEDDTIRSLAYCQYDVESCWQAYQERVLGKPPQEFPKDASQRAEREKILDHLDALMARLAQSSEISDYRQISEALNQTLSALRSLRSQLEVSGAAFKPTEIYSQLKGLEEELVSAIERTLPLPQAAQLFVRAEQKLAGYKEDMSPQVYTETLRTVFRKELKALFPLLPFDLF